MKISEFEDLKISDFRLPVSPFLNLTAIPNASCAFVTLSQFTLSAVEGKGTGTINLPAITNAAPCHPELVSGSDEPITNLPPSVIALTV